jgi:catechol-2,3-dioxygenase
VIPVRDSLKREIKISRETLRSIFGINLTTSSQSPGLHAFGGWYHHLVVNEGWQTPRRRACEAWKSNYLPSAG